MIIKFRRLLIIISFFCLPITLAYISPVIIIQDSFKGIICGSFIVYCIVFLSSLFFGRLYCSWLCPCGGLQECLNVLNLKKASNKGNYIKYFVWFLWLCVVIYAAILAGGYKSINFFGHTQNGVSLITIPGALAYPMYYIVLTLVTILSLVFGKRSFCHNICWLAPFMIIGTKIGRVLQMPNLHIEIEQENCISCKKCNSACPMSLNVEHLVKTGTFAHTECILCGECKFACSKQVFSYKFGKQRQNKLSNLNKKKDCHLSNKSS